MSEQSPTGFVRLYRVLMLPSVFKPLRLLRAVQTRNPGQDAVMEQTIKAASYFVSTLFIASGLVQALSVGNAAEWGDLNASGLDENRMAFHDALYFIIVTFRQASPLDMATLAHQTRNPGSWSSC
ncbi:unnamed protein product [Sphacelaria rigidula]